MRRTHRCNLSFVLGLSLSLGACAHGSAPALRRAVVGGSAEVQLKPLGDGQVQGVLQLSPADEGGVRIAGQFSGLGAEVRHGIHIHEGNRCAGPDGASAGPHFNPHGGSHGDPTEAGAHLGDLGNLVSDAQGVARIDIVRRGLSIEDGDAAILGRTVIVHAKADDLHTQPAGDSGPRVACGVVRRSQP